MLDLLAPPGIGLKQEDEMARNLVVGFLRDLGRLEPIFSRRLIRAFESLGRIAEDAFWAVHPRVEVRQSPTPEDADEAERILQRMGVTQWTQDALLPAYDGHYLRVLNQTVGTINSTVGLSVNLPDPVQMRVIRQGGTRLGLIDVQGQARRTLYRIIAEAREEGLGPPDIARRIRTEIPAGRYRSTLTRGRVIARTETKYAQNVSSLETYRRSVNYTHVRVFDAQLGDTDSPCEIANGQTWTYERADAEPLQHPNCTRSFAPVRVGPSVNGAG